MAIASYHRLKLLPRLARRGIAETTPRGSHRHSRIYSSRKCSIHNEVLLTVGDVEVGVVRVRTAIWIAVHKCIGG